MPADPDPGPESRPDVIVVGLGVIGLAACWRLAQRGLRVLGIEQFDLFHDRGGSHGSTRIVRHACFESPQYVRPMEEALEGWRELERAAQRPLLNLCGALYAGRERSRLVRGARASAREHGIELEELDPVALRERFGVTAPGGDDWRALLEPGAGFLHAGRAMDALAEQARAAGATLRDCCYVEAWRQEGEGVVVETDDGEFEAARLVLATGAWAREEFARLGVTFEVLRKLTFWYLAPDPARVLPGALPVLMADTGEGFFYSIPDGQDTAEDGVKLARHDEAPEVLESALLDELEELHVEHHIDEQEELVRPTVEAFARQWLGSHLVHPGSGDLVPSDLGVVQNTYSPDRHPVIDRHPMHDRVVLAGGFSGQGFKFAPAYGRLIADLCADAPGSTAEFLRLGRFSHIAG